MSTKTKKDGGTVSIWNDLTTELDRWSDNGIRATFWWRDDDAVEHTPALHRLYSHSSEHGIPLTLAVIPHAANKNICTGDDRPQQLRLVQHGYAHINHAPDTEKKSEFGLHRETDDVIRDIRSGLSSIGKLPDFFAAFVPPWNRISATYYRCLVDAGVRGLSTFGARENRAPIPGLVQANTHADIVDWHGARGFVGTDYVCSQILNHLIARRAQTCDFEEPTGVLTHHLVHDDACWDFLDTLFGTLKGHSAVKWLNGAEVFTA
jgi:hypothetical protein